MVAASKVARALLVAVVALLLAGCGNDPSSPDTDPGGHFTVTTVTVGDRKIPCITWWPSNGGGLSCDWGAK